MHAMHAGAVSMSGQRKGPPSLPAARTRDATASQPLELVFREHAAFVWRVLSRMGVAEADLDDALQEVFLVVARTSERYEERGSIRAWLFTLARQEAQHARRSQRRREARHHALAQHTASDHDTRSPERIAEQRQSAARVREALDSLDPDQAMAFFLADIEGFTMPEIASALGINLNTAYGRLRLARKRMEAYLHGAAAQDDQE